MTLVERSCESIPTDWHSTGIRVLPGRKIGNITRTPFRTERSQGLSIADRVVNIYKGRYLSILVSVSIMVANAVAREYLEGSRCIVQVGIEIFNGPFDIAFLDQSGFPRAFSELLHLVMDVL